MVLDGAEEDERMRCCRGARRCVIVDACEGGTYDFFVKVLRLSQMPSSITSTDITLLIQILH